MWRAPRRLLRPATLAPGTLVDGGVSERPKEHASKACEVQASVGSNPTATALGAARRASLLALPRRRRAVERAKPAITANKSGTFANRRRSDPRPPVSPSFRPNWLIGAAPEQLAHSVRHAVQDREREVLVAGHHRRVRPAHQAHDRPLGHTQNQQDRGRRMPRVMQPALAKPGSQGAAYRPRSARLTACGRKPPARRPRPQPGGLVTRPAFSPAGHATGRACLPSAAPDHPRPDNRVKGACRRRYAVAQAPPLTRLTDRARRQLRRAGTSLSNRPRGLNP